MECGSRAPAFAVRAEARLQKQQLGCRTPNLAVYVLQVRFKGDVGAECLRTNFLQRKEFEIGRDGERHARFAGDLGRIEQKKLVDHSYVEGGAVQGWAGFEKDAQDFAAAKFGENGFEIDLTVA